VVDLLEAVVVLGEVLQDAGISFGLRYGAAYCLADQQFQQMLWNRAENWARVLSQSDFWRSQTLF
jgi:hypothetical protein